MADRRISLLLCDDHRILTDAVASVVSGCPDLVLVADPVDNAEDAVALCVAHHPDVVLMDIELVGDHDGIEATRRIKAVSPQTKVVVMSGSRRRTVLLEAVEAGASGFLDKTEAVGEVLDVVRAAAAGEILVDPVVLTRMVSDLASERHAERVAEGRVARLTRREREVLCLLGQGLRNDVIADQLYLSVHTVDTHVRNILSKLGVHSKLEAVAVAARTGSLSR